MAVSILAVVTTVTYMTFSVVATAWKRGTEMADNLHHGDFLADQLVMALRSAYYPQAREPTFSYGFWLDDNGDGQGASDAISWVKLGSSLVGDDCDFAGSPHRVRFAVEAGPGGEPAATVRYWRLHGQMEGFRPEQSAPNAVLSERVTGFNCRCMDRKDLDEMEWQDEWKETNRVPCVVELTFYLRPLEEGGDPVELKRIVEIPVAHLTRR